jgi:hypothetical protein
MIGIAACIAVIGILIFAIGKAAAVADVEMARQRRP